MKTKTKTDFLEILRVLLAYEIDFIVVGGVSAVLQGAPIATFDLDLVHSREPENIKRLLRALESLEAIYRAQPARRIKPTAAHLSSPGHQLLLTRFGPLDLLGMIGSGRGYEQLLAKTVEMKVDDELRIRVLDLETLIQTKEEIGGEKDAAVLPSSGRLSTRSQGIGNNSDPASPLLRHRQPVHLNLEQMIDADAVAAVGVGHRSALGFRVHYFAVDHEVDLVGADAHFERIGGFSAGVGFLHRVVWRLR